MTIPQSVKKHDAGHIPGSIEIPNDVEARLFWLDSTTSRNMFAFIDSSVAPSFALTPTIVTAVANALATSWTANCAAFSPTNVIFQGCDMRDRRPPGNNPIVSPSPYPNAPGTSASTSLPHSIAAVLTKRTARSGQAFRGRMYIPGWAQNADSGDGVIAPGLVTALGVFAQAILAALSAQAMVPGLAQPARAQYMGVTGTVHPARTASVVPLTQLFLRNNVWDNQRRRGGAGG